MAIKRGVSLYSYQQAQFFKKMTWKDQIVEVHDNLKTDGIEIIDEQLIRNYPFPSDEFISSQDTICSLLQWIFISMFISSVTM